jgi:hypothetical protein
MGVELSVPHFFISHHSLHQPSHLMAAKKQQHLKLLLVT